MPLSIATLPLCLGASVAYRDFSLSRHSLGLKKVRVLFTASGGEGNESAASAQWRMPYHPSFPSTHPLPLTTQCNPNRHKHGL